MNATLIKKWKNEKEKKMIPSFKINEWIDKY